jgi:hypothetical protein
MLWRRVTTVEHFNHKFRHSCQFFKYGCTLVFIALLCFDVIESVILF